MAVARALVANRLRLSVGRGGIPPSTIGDMYACMYVFMYLCLFVCMYVCDTFACTKVSLLQHKNVNVPMPAGMIYRGKC